MTKHFLRTALAACALALLAACVYRINIQQGNYLDQAAVNQVKPGMTRSQVRYLLGTPLVSNLFDTSRWDYVYYFKRGYVQKPIESRVTVFFHGDKVSSFKLYNVPKGSPISPGMLPSVDKFPI